MDRGTLSNYGWVVIVVIILAILIALATPFGNYISGGTKTILAQFSEGANIDIEFGDGSSDGSESGNDSGSGSGSGSGDVTPNPALNHSGIIPEGATYTPLRSAELKAGSSMPSISGGDIYTYSDYEYTYNANEDGWAVVINTDVTDETKTEYGKILESINGKPITNVSKTFTYCTSLITAPSIPNSVKNMYGTFDGCRSLTTAPVIPKSVVNLSAAFKNCISLTVAPIIPYGVENTQETFCGCTALKTYVGSKAADGDFSGYIIPNSVTEMTQMFRRCASLTAAPAIPNSVNGLYYTFWECTSLIIAPEIPENIATMTGTFKDCTSLTTAPIIPSGMSSLSGIFDSCTSLTGTVTINSNPGNYANCFSDVDFKAQNLTLTGTSTILDTIGVTGINYCKECNGCCQNNH